MAFVPLTSAQIVAGEATKQELFDLIKENFDDHESRIADVEAFTTSTIPFEFDVQGAPFPGDGQAFLRIPISITVTGVKVTSWIAGTAGTLTVDIERKVGAGAWATILNAPISTPYTDGDYNVESSSGIAIPSIAAGTFLRLNIDSMQDGMSGFTVQVEYTVNA